MTNQELVRAAVRDEAEKHGILDAQVVDLFDVSGISFVDGKPRRSDVVALVRSMRGEKPHLFTADASKLNAVDFSGLEHRLRAGDPADHERERLPEGLKGLDAGQLTGEELHSLHCVVTGAGSSHDFAILSQAARQQGVTLVMPAGGA